MARPRFIPTDNERKIVEHLSGLAVTQRAIATTIRDGIDKDTLAKHFRRELDIGMAKAHVKAAEEIYRRALAGSDLLLIWYAKTQMRWTAAKDEPEQQAVMINIVGGLPDE